MLRLKYVESVASEELQTLDYEVRGFPHEPSKAFIGHDQFCRHFGNLPDINHLMVVVTKDITVQGKQLMFFRRRVKMPDDCTQVFLPLNPSFSFSLPTKQNEFGSITGHLDIYFQKSVSLEKGDPLFITGFMQTVSIELEEVTDEADECPDDGQTNVLRENTGKQEARN